MAKYKSTFIDIVKVQNWWYYLLLFTFSQEDEGKTNICFFFFATLHNPLFNDVVSRKFQNQVVNNKKKIQSFFLRKI